MSLGIEVWVAAELGYAPKESDSEKYAKLNFVANSKAMNALLSRLSEEKFIKVMHNKTTKEIWDTVESILTHNLSQ